MVLRRFLFHAAHKAATDPAVRAKAAEVFERDVKPLAKAAWAETRPKLEAARDNIRDAAATNDPRRDPAGFAGELKRKITRNWRPKKDR